MEVWLSQRVSRALAFETIRTKKYASFFRPECFVFGTLLQLFLAVWADEYFCKGGEGGEAEAPKGGESGAISAGAMATSTEAPHAEHADPLVRVAHECRIVVECNSLISTIRG